jgi:serine/threonine protein phosphatase 1
MGDPHGRLDAFLNVLEQVKFDYKNDQLIIVGDFCDGGPDTKNLVDEILKIDNRICILGNHDYWFRQWLHGDHPERIWLKQGGKATLRSYGYDYFGHDPTLSKIPKEHVKFFDELRPWYEDKDAIFVHGGFSYKDGIEKTSNWDAMWDRTLLRCEYTQFKVHGKNLWNGKLIIVGHTCSQLVHNPNDKQSEKDKPVITDTVIGLDTGAGHGAKLTLMELPSRQYWQSTLPFVNIIRNEEKREWPNKGRNNALFK